MGFSRLKESFEGRVSFPSEETRECGERALKEGGREGGKEMLYMVVRICIVFSQHLSQRVSLEIKKNS